MRRYLCLLVVAAALPGIDVAPAAAQYGEHVGETFEASFGAYRIKIRGPRKDYRGDGELWIFRNDDLVYYDSKSEFDIHEDVPIGTDLTRSGGSNLVIQQFTGGAHCCLIALIFELGRELVLIDTINGLDGPVDFVREDSSGRWLVRMEDWTFRYFFATFSASTACDLTLAWQRGRFRPIDLRRSPKPRDELNRLATTIRNSRLWRGRGVHDDPMEPYDTRLTSEMVNLAYTGNLSQALKLLHLAWPLGLVERRGFERNFLSSLHNSASWPDIHAITRMPPPHGFRPNDAAPVCTNER
jgi:hypothetical protein